MLEEDSVKTEQQEEAHVMYLNGIDYNLTVEEVRTLIISMTHGLEPTNVSLPTRQNSTMNNGFVFITFKSSEELRKAIQDLHDKPVKDAQGNIQRRFLAQEARSSDSRSSRARSSFGSRGHFARGPGFGFRGGYSAGRGRGFGNTAGFSSRGHGGFARNGTSAGLGRFGGPADVNSPPTDDCIIVKNMNFGTKQADVETYLHSKGIKVLKMIISKPRMPGQENGGTMYMRFADKETQEEAIKTFNSLRMDDRDIAAKHLSENDHRVPVLRGQTDLSQPQER